MATVSPFTDTATWIEVQSVPFAPTSVAATAGDKWANVSWTASVDNGAAVTDNASIGARNNVGALIDRGLANGRTACQSARHGTRPRLRS